MPIPFYLEETSDYVIERVELLFQEDDQDEDERQSQADYERLAERFNA